MINSKWLFGLENLEEVKKIRETVLKDELGYSVIADEDDDMALHILVGENEQYYACGRIYDNKGEFYIGMICVDPLVRGKNLGSLVARLLIAKGFELLADKIYVNSRVKTQGFYEKLNFEVCGDQYVDINGEKTIPMVLLKSNSPIKNSCEGCSGCKNGC